MVHKIDLELLLQNLQGMPEAPPPEYTPGVRYLLGVLVIPLLEDRTVVLDSLNYDRFSYDDLNALLDHLEYAGRQACCLGDLASSLCKLPPCSALRPVFC